MRKNILAVLLSVITVFVFTACGAETLNTSQMSEDEISTFLDEPDKFKGRTIEYSGYVANIEEKGDGFYLRVICEKYDREENIIAVCKDLDYSIKTNDCVTIKGTVKGSYKEKTYFGIYSVTPLITAKKIEEADFSEAFPAEKTVKIGETIKKKDYIITLTKVDFIENKARVFLKIENKGKKTFVNYPDDAVIIQNGKQYQVGLDSHAPNPVTHIASGASVETILFFDRLEEKPFTFYIEGFDKTDGKYLEFKFSVDM